MADNNLLANNLAQLGGQIASTFQNVALQNQYKNSLPAMQQVFQQSMADFDSGKTGAGFARIMDVAMQNPNNPYIQNMAQMAFKAGQLASDDYFKRQQINILQQKANNAARPTSGTSSTDLITALNADGTVTEEEQVTTPAPSIAAMAGARGQPFPFKQIREQQASRLGATQASPQSTMAQLEGELPTQVSAGEGLLKPADKEMELERKFASQLDKFAAMPLDQKIVEDDGTSLTFENDTEIQKYISKTKKGSKFVPISKSAQLALPGVTGFMIPEEYSKWANKGFTINKKGEVSQNIGKENLNTPEARKAQEWYAAFNDAAISADSNPKLRGLLSSAGGIMNIEFQPVKRPPTQEEQDAGVKEEKQIQTYQASIRGSNKPPVELTKDEVKTLELLNSKTAAMSVMGAKALRDKSQIAKAEPAQPAKNLSPNDQKALDWANANPNDARAKLIKQKLGI
jgi:hypothetical protein